MPAERLGRWLARQGIASRRGADELLRQGRVRVNRVTASPSGQLIEPDRDLIEVDGRPVASEQRPRRYLVLNKPVGVVSTVRDPEGRPTVFDCLPAPRGGRWIVVGRLDVNTAGLLLFTTDGAIAHGLMHPSRQIEREYLVRVRGRPSAAALHMLRAGLMLEDGPAAFDRIVEQPQAAAQRDARNGAYRVVLHEGRNREVRRLWEAAGHEVSRLLRVRYGPIALPHDLRPGGWRYLDAAALAALRAAAAPPAGA